MQAASKLTVTPVAAAVAAALSPSQAVQAQNAAESSRGTLEEIVVTARKRTESAQEIPIAIQALSQDSLAAMGAKSMEDFARFIPSVNVVTYSNTSSVIVFRGAITGAGYIAQSTSSVYLDEIAITTTGSQPSVRMVDIQRVEALSGPQGTLYGSDAQAGTMKIVTNKPDPSGYSAAFDGEIRGGDHSDMSYRGSLMFNVPLVEDKLALRVVGYNDRDGGFIDNVFGHTPDSAALPTGPDYPSGFGTLDNSQVIDDRWNDAEVTGGRAALRWDMSDNWSATVSASGQKTDTGADNYFDPYVGDLQTVRFHDEWTDDKFSLYSLTLDADLGFAQLVSATSYYDRKLNYLSDTTSYTHYWAARYCHDTVYTQADYPGYWEDPNNGTVVWWPRYCNAPTVEGDNFLASFLHAQQDKFTQEIRLSHSGDTVDWLVGLYYESSNDDWQSSFSGPTTGGDGSVNVYDQSVSRAFWEWYFGTPLPGTTSHWYSQSATDWEQKAVFGEATWHINDQWDLTLGGRYFDRTNTQFYQVNHPGAFGALGEPDIDDPAARRYILRHGGPKGRKGQDKEFIPKVSLSYSFGENQMAYGLYTQGKRPGGINRTRGEPFFSPNYESDLMSNYEIGYKSLFAGGAGRFNSTIYHMAWEDYQLELVDPSSVVCLDSNGQEDLAAKIPGVCGQPWQRVVANAGKAHITGVNVEIDYAPSENWVLGMNAEWMEAETDTDHDLDGEEDANGNLTNELVSGLRLPIVPKFKAAGWIEYHWPVQWEGEKNAFIRTQWSYTGDTYNVLEPLTTNDANPQLRNQAYVIGDIRFGLQGDTWEATFFVNNVTDKRAQYTHRDGWMEWAMASIQDGRPHLGSIYTNRPREIGIHFMKSWGE